jgi:hypothetical protein
MSDPADLSNLRDIVVPPPVPWWPPAPGWWIVAAALAAALAMLAVHVIRHHRHNAYRRAALAELAALDSADDPARARAISAILKRTALVAYPRAEVASLTGAAWLAFLDRTAGTDAFTKGPAAALERAAYGAPTGDDAALAAAARRWVKRHRAAE